MKAMGWDYQQLAATPGYVKSFVLDFLALESQAAEHEADKHRD